MSPRYPTSSLTNTDIDNPDISKIAGDAQPVSYVPFRNQLFNTIGCAYAEAKGAILFGMVLLKLIALQVIGMVVMSSLVQ